MTNVLVKVLLVEDSASDAEFLQETLQHARFGRFAFSVACRLSEALRQLPLTSFDVVLLDRSLPDSTGADTFRRVRDVAPQTPIVVLTGCEDELTGIEALRHGAQDYLVKQQVDAEQIARAIRYAIERKQAEQEFLKSEARFRVMAETVPEVLYTTCPDGRTDYVNPRFCQYTGLPPGAFDGFPRTDLLHPDDAAAGPARWEKSLRTGRPFDAEYRLRGVDGTYRWFSDRARPIRDERGGITKWFGACTDIHDLKSAEERLEVLNETLERRVAERTAEAERRAVGLRALAAELTRVEKRERERLGHVLRDHLQQLLVSAQFQVDLLEMDLRAKKQRQVVQKLREQLGEALESSRSLAVELCPPVLHELGLNAALKWLGRWIEDKHRLKVTIEADEAPEVSEHLRAFLFQSARELLFNVVKHARVPAASLQCRRPHPGWVELRVDDAGAGFADDGRTHIQASQAGFGLFRIRGRAQLVGGSLSVESRPGGNPCFRDGPGTCRLGCRCAASRGGKTLPSGGSAFGACGSGPASMTPELHHAMSARLRPQRRRRAADGARYRLTADGAIFETQWSTVPEWFATDGLLRMPRAGPGPALPPRLNGQPPVLVTTRQASGPLWSSMVGSSAKSSAGR